MTPLIIMVGADKGGVGKTTVARALDDYLIARGAVAKLFDSEWPAGDLKRFSPSATVIDIERVGDQMKVFDALEGVTVLDIRAGLLSPTLRALDEAQLLTDIRGGKINLALLHVLGPSIASFNEIDQAARLVGGGTKHFIVKNYINETGFFDWDSDNRFATIFAQMSGMTVSVPHIPAQACEMIQKLGGSFSAFTVDDRQSRILRGYVRSWLNKVWEELDRVGLGKMVRAALPEVSP
ncbi:MAG TPA: hypothetical protein VKW08_07725 [Xanthobacteraceae bacterium]|nr:hypothetical protein [Xanthobacteraceae bacterium]